MNDYQLNTDKIISFIDGKFFDENLDNDSLVQIIESCGKLLNLQTISSYAKGNKLSYNGVKKFRKVKVIFGQKFVIDND